MVEKEGFLQLHDVTCDAWLRLNDRKLILLCLLSDNSEILELQSLLGERAFSNFLCKLKSSRADGTVRNYLRCFND